MVIRVGIIGLSADQSAWATMAHVEAMKEGGPLSEHFKLTALVTSNPDSAKAAAKSHGLPLEKGYSNAEDIANDPDVDLVVVSVKVPMHKQLSMPALRAKKDIFVEWPLASSLADAEEMAALAKKQGVKTWVGLQARMQPAMVKAKEIVTSGILGRITSTTVLGIDSQLLNLPEKARYVNYPTSGASILSIPCAHTLDVVLHVLGSELSSLSATTSITYHDLRYISAKDGSLSDPEPKKAADNIALSGTLTPANAALSFHYLITAPATPSIFQWIICGEKGALKMEGPTFAVQMTTATKLYLAEMPKDGGTKGMYDSREGGAAWKEVEIPKTEFDGCFGGVAPLYEGIAKGKGKDEGIVDFDEAVTRHKMLEAIARSAEKGTRESSSGLARREEHDLHLKPCRGAIDNSALCSSSIFENHTSKYSSSAGATFTLASAAAGFLGRGSSGNASSMRGLVQFIADLRNARARDLEEKRINKELANVRQKFKEGNLNGYHRKKYVCKLLYIYILGWNVDFGHLEAVNLISANKYSEKQIGYLAVTLFLHEQHELLHLVVNSIRKDLLENNELFNCLALHAIANVGGREMGEALSGDVHRLLISPTSKAFVKKKAALTLLRLYRKYPGIVQHEWAERIISLMDDPDMGVTLSVTSLVMALAQDDPDQYKGACVKAAQRLKKVVVDHEIAADYLYYKVPCPWIQVKLLRLMQYFPPSEDTHVRDLIRESLQQILHEAMQMPKNVQQNNAQNAVLFEAINLVIHLDTERELMIQISSRLGKFIQSRETNVRYLGLEAMTHFAARAETLDPIKKHQNIILGSLRDRDISVRRKGLDLLYSMCDTTNAQPITNELLKYLQNADFAIREEMVLKIAILTEKYATDIQWYVDISLRLIALAGDHISDEVWQRIIQIVTNNEGLQVYAARNILEYVKAEQCHETLVKIGGYLLGEFGHLIADNKGCNPIDQFLALSTKLSGCSSSTRAIILSSFVKFVNLFPEIKNQLLYVFRAYSHTLDPELQQRACEYLTLATLPTDDLLRTVCDEMPPFPERTSALLSRLHGKHANSSDKRTWVVGGKDANADPKEILLTQPTGPSAQEKRSITPSNNPLSPIKTLTNGTSGPKTNGHTDLEGLDLTPTTPSKPPNLASAAHLSPNWEPGYRRLLTSDEGILYEDAQLQIGLRSEYRGPMGCLIIYFTNRSPSPIASFTTTLNNPSASALKIDTKSLPDSTIPPDAQAQQTVIFNATAAPPAPPTVRISYLAGALQALTLQLPVVLHKFMDPAELSAEDFFKRWRQIGGAPREAQRVFGLADGGKRTGMSEESTMLVVQGMRWGVLKEVDPNRKNVVGASVCHLVGGKVGCLVRLEPNYESQMYRATIRATDESVPPVLMKLMEEMLAPGVERI